jgi:hypothetical protein
MDARGRAAPWPRTAACRSSHPRRGPGGDGPRRRIDSAAAADRREPSRRPRGAERRGGRRPRQGSARVQADGHALWLALGRRRDSAEAPTRPGCRTVSRPSRPSRSAKFERCELAGGRRHQGRSATVRADGRAIHRAGAAALMLGRRPGRADSPGRPGCPADPPGSGARRAGPRTGTLTGLHTGIGPGAPPRPASAGRRECGSCLFPVHRGQWFAASSLPPR